LGEHLLTLLAAVNSSSNGVHKWADGDDDANLPIEVLWRKFKGEKWNWNRKEKGKGMIDCLRNGMMPSSCPFFNLFFHRLHFTDKWLV
jgi:hypothetical protein